MASIPEGYRDLFAKPTIAHLATVLSDGTPHVTPVWIDYDVDADRLLVNTARDTQKAANVASDPRVGVSMTDPDDPYRRLSITGEVDDATTEGAREHVDALARRYTGSDYDGPGDARLLLRIRPETVVAEG